MLSHQYTFRTVVKRDPWDYFGDLHSDCSCGPEPHYSALVAEHQMRQRAKKRWDEQQPLGQVMPP